MKLIVGLTLSFLIPSTLIFAQSSFPIDSATGKIKFSEIVKVDSSSKELLYSKAREWFVKNFNSSKTVLDMEDKEYGKLIGKGNFIAYTEESLEGNEFISNKDKKILSKNGVDMKIKRRAEVGNISFILAIYVKDNRYKYEITSLTHKGKSLGSTGYTIPDWGDLSNDVPACGYSELIPRIRWSSIKENAFFEITNLIADLKLTMSDKDKTQDF